MNWASYRSVVEKNISYVEEWETTDPVRCLRCGTLLQEVNGELHCKFDGWIWSGTNDDKP